MEKIFGKCGGVLWEYANGMECSPVSEYGVFSDVKSVGNSSTSPFDITSPEAARALIMVLCESVGTRLREHGMRCGNVAVSARTKTLVTSEKSEKLKSPILSTRALYENAVRIFEGWYDWKEPIRSIGVRAQSLSVGTGTQISLFEDEYSAEEIDRVIDSLGRRFGYGTVTRGRAMLHRIRERPPLAFGAASRGAHDPTLPPAEIEVC
ncbi:DNA polymerase IV [bioreactor metagenome]|uniref:DNA polymerase IV n=1 Tax=bioreactor metagenome TaxID=1076179 RepID=A0A645FAV8_9ZZZZ